jgi:hypothetical protein
MMKSIYKFLIIFISVTALSGCNKLDVKNINNPDREHVLSTPEGLKALAGSLFNQWFRTEQHNLNSPGPSMCVMADWGTVTFANYGCVDLSKEPREFYNNTPSYRYHRNIRNYWRNMYSVLSSANDVLTGINQGIEIGENGEETAMVKGMAYMMQGLANGYIGLVFDKAYPSDETTDLEHLEVTSYHESIDMAVSQLEKAIQVFDNNSFTLPQDWMTKPFTNEDLSKIAHSFIARLLVYSARNQQETDAVDWQSVLNHAQQGITEDFSIEGDGNGSDRKWMSWLKYYMARPSWGKVDMRIIHLLDPAQPANWPAAGLAALPNAGIMNSNDDRADTDFAYNSSNNRPERGTYRWSTYRYTRFDDYIQAHFFAPVILMRKTENDMLKAEALARLNRFTEAAAIVNAGTRVNRGHLPPVSNNGNLVMKAIFYERTIELPLTGMGIEYFDMRRTGQLQDGSLLHFPIPAQQLEILQEPFYTFGGIDPQYGVPGQDVAINGWYTPTP